MAESNYMEDFETFMWVVAHPDDLEFSSAGTVAKLAKAGKRCILIQVTSGDRGTANREFTPETLRETRESEMNESARRLGLAYLDGPIGLGAALGPGALSALGLQAGSMSPGFLAMLGISALAGLIATTAAVLAAYYGSVTSFRLGMDPDTYGIPIITAAVDLFGFASLIIALSVFGLAG